MKAISIFALVLAIMMSAGIGCLIIFEAFTLEQGVVYLSKTVAAIALLGASAAVIALLTGSRDAPSE
ncbi:MAG: hypothetical protein ACR2RV_10260 [Verrucomicrobiales bacterium]